MSSSRQLKNIVMSSKQNTQVKTNDSRILQTKELCFYNPYKVNQVTQEYYPLQKLHQGSQHISNNHSKDQSKIFLYINLSILLAQIYSHRQPKNVIDKKSNITDDDLILSPPQKQQNQVKLHKILNQTLNNSKIPLKTEAVSLNEENYQKKKEFFQLQDSNIKKINQSHIVTQNSVNNESSRLLQLSNQNTKNRLLLGNFSERSLAKPINYLNYLDQRKNSQQTSKVQLLTTTGKPQNNSLNKLLQTIKSPQQKVKAQLNTSLSPSTVDKKLNLGEGPWEPTYILKNFDNFLTEFERKEIHEFQNIFYFGQNIKKQPKTQNEQLNYGYDNDRGDYLFDKYDHIAYRYEIRDNLGRGSFGQTVLVYDHKRKIQGALKIIRNKKKFHSQALIEIQVLKIIKEKDSNPNCSSLIKIKDYFVFRNHVCILFELLSINLYEFLRSNCFVGVSLDLIRRFAIQLLQALLFLEQQRIIHCDLKPENILLKEKNKSGIKIIDFGSSCLVDERLYTYIQSRFYRAPEIILGMEYGFPIDMWSFGCIMVELFTGQPIFSSESEKDHFSMMLEVISLPPTEMINQCTKRAQYFTETLDPIIKPNNKGKMRVIGSKPLQNILKNSSSNFIDFVKGCIKWMPSERLKPAEALVHEWILEGLPTQIKEQHLKSMKEAAPWLKIFQEETCFTTPNGMTDEIKKVKEDTLNTTLNLKTTESIPFFPLNISKNESLMLQKKQSLKKFEIPISQNFEKSTKFKQGVQGESIQQQSHQTLILVESLKQKLNSNIQRKKQI